MNGTSDEANNIAEKSPATINVEFLVVQNNEVLNFTNSKYPIADHPELANVSGTLNALAHGIQLAARIVDTPCNEMNVDHFIEVRFLFQELEIYNRRDETNLNKHLLHEKKHNLPSFLGWLCATRKFLFLRFEPYLPKYFIF